MAKPHKYLNIQQVESAIGDALLIQNPKIVNQIKMLARLVNTTPSKYAAEVLACFLVDQRSHQND
jgi:hypothetical protein